jgi:hypothetical protein
MAFFLLFSFFICVGVFEITMPFVLQLKIGVFDFQKSMLRFVRHAGIEESDSQLSRTCMLGEVGHYWY